MTDLNGGSLYVSLLHSLLKGKNPVILTDSQTLKRLTIIMIVMMMTVMMMAVVKMSMMVVIMMTTILCWGMH